MPERLFDHTIGNLIIHEEQANCAHEIIKVFERQGGPPILIAQMQQGKTGVCIKVVDQVINNCETTNKKYQIIFLTNISDNELKGQTTKRLRLAGLSSKVDIIHHADLKGGFEPKIDVDIRLIIIDECHIALEKSVDSKPKPFHEFLKKCGIKYGQSINTWENKNNYVLSVSATPYAQVIWSKINEKAFESVVLEVNENYYSIQQMKKDNRFRQSEPVAKNGKVTKFFIKCMEEFISSCKINGNGHMIVRAVGSAPDAIKDLIKEKYPICDVEIYESSPINNIKDLDDTLGEEFPRPFVAIIRGCLRAGKTLQTTKHIRMWIEPPGSKTDTMCQVVGRCLGFEMINGTNRKFEDTFPVYCNMKDLDSAIEFYNNQNCVPRGNNNKSTIKERNYKMYFAKTANEIPEKYRVERKDGSIAAEKISTNNAQNLAQAVLNGVSRSGAAPHISIDGPNKNHQEDWDRLMFEHPDWIDGFTYYVPDDEKFEKPSIKHMNPDLILLKG
jgi:hypothetical protein